MVIKKYKPGFVKNRVLLFYRPFQNNILFQPQDNLVSIGKNSQIKPRKSEQGQGVKITRRNMIIINKLEHLYTVRFNAL